ncbi:hypothetical protein V2J09_008530 [Rumex salicifolius]
MSQAAEIITTTSKQSLEGRNTELEEEEGFMYQKKKAERGKGMEGWEKNQGFRPLVYSQHSSWEE